MQYGQSVPQSYRATLEEIELEAEALRGLEANPRCVRLYEANSDMRKAMISHGQWVVISLFVSLTLWGGLGLALMAYVNGWRW